jgi:hypothetical protein
MRIHGIVVSVDYADLLAPALPIWTSSLDGLTVVTALHDEETKELVRRHVADSANCGSCEVACYATGVFYADGCSFNKGRAMSEAWEHLAGTRPIDWVLTFDADIIPPSDWRGVVEAARPAPGSLFGAYRSIAGSNHTVEERDINGFFSLWHASDPNVQQRPLYDVQWRHAGGYDTEFQSRWPSDRRIKLPMTLEHQGAPAANWWGRGNRAATAVMQFRRRILLGRIDEVLERLRPEP